MMVHHKRRAGRKLLKNEAKSRNAQSRAEIELVAAQIGDPRAYVQDPPQMQA